MELDILFKCGTYYPSNTINKLKLFENYKFSNFKIPAVSVFKPFIFHKLGFMENVLLDKLFIFCEQNNTLIVTINLKQSNYDEKCQCENTNKIQVLLKVNMIYI